MPFRIYQPPLPVNFLCTETSRCFKLRAVRPTAIPVPAVGAGMGGKILFLILACLGEFLIRMNLAGPVAVFELPVFVHERKKLLLCIRHVLRRLFSFPFYELQFGNTPMNILFVPPRCNAYLTDVR